LVEREAVAFFKKYPDDLFLVLDDAESLHTGDHRRLLRGGVGDNVGYGVSGLIEKRVNDGSSAFSYSALVRAHCWGNPPVSQQWE